LKMMEEMFGRHPYHRDPLGSQETVTNLEREHVVSQFERVLNPANMAFALVGDVDIHRWQERLNQIVKRLNTGKKQEWPPAEDFSLKDNREVKVTQAKEQAHVCFAFPGLDLKDPRRPVLDLLQGVLSGQGGRLFIELRDKASLAYSVSPVRMDGIGAGYFGAYIGCSPEKVEKAKRMMKEELQKLATHLIPDEELERAKRHLIGRHDIGLQRNSAIASEMVLNEIYGLPFDEYLRTAETYQAVRSEDIRKLAEDLFAQKSVTAIVGP
jgi:zinc protease